ncbi:hypothetical protein DENIT_40077 [Pseudomonas veronii]|nr:hypothetical protein DENIT_40077 [Pseudomonas veronii]
MHNDLRAAIDESFLNARQALGAKSPQRAYPWLERAHILTQRMPLLHAYSHWLMFLAGWEERDYREMLGQAARIPAALLFSKIWCLWAVPDEQESAPFNRCQYQMS